MTKNEALELLEAVNIKLDSNMVDDRLLDKKNNLEKLIKSFEEE